MVGSNMIPLRASFNFEAAQEAALEVLVLPLASHVPLHCTALH